MHVPHAFLLQCVTLSDGKNQLEYSEDTETIDKASGSSSSNDSRKQGRAGRSFKTSGLRLFLCCNYMHGAVCTWYGAAYSTVLGQSDPIWLKLLKEALVRILHFPMFP